MDLIGFLAHLTRNSTSSPKDSRFSNMDRAARGRRGRGRGAGRNPAPRVNTRANARDNLSSAGSDAANSANEATHSLTINASLSGGNAGDSVHQENVHVDPLTFMQGMMAQMTQMANLMQTMHNSVTQNQQNHPPPC
ncbi:hypothetical protein OROMI_005966 [Orobanche minor]